MNRFKGVATTKNGTEVRIVGTFNECIRWVDDMMKQGYTYINVQEEADDLQKLWQYNGKSGS